MEPRYSKINTFPFSVTTAGVSLQQLSFLQSQEKNLLITLTTHLNQPIFPSMNYKNKALNY